MQAQDWSPDVDARLRAEVAALLRSHDLRHWHALLTELHPRIVAFAASALRRAGPWGRRGCQGSAMDEQALDVALMVCADLRSHDYQRLAVFRGLDVPSGAPFRGYIAKITRQTAFRYLRTEVIRPDGGRRALTSEAQSVGPVTLDRIPALGGPDTGTRAAHRIAEREAQLALLSPEQRAILGFYLRGFSPAEIARLPDMSLDAANVQKLLRSAKAKLKYHFGGGRP
ncbi:MAG: sigma-70 family RNA polymerase sigma factor [Myxococcota bacterium]